MIKLDKKFSEDTRTSLRLNKKQQNIPLEQLVGQKYVVSGNYKDSNNNSIQTILINFDKEITNYWLIDTLPFYDIWYEDNEKKNKLDLENSIQQEFLVDYIKKIFQNGLYKIDNKSWKIIDNKQDIKNTIKIEFKNKLGESCKMILDNILKDNKQDFLYYYSQKIMNEDKAILSLFNLDTLHDISRVQFLEKTYNKLFNRNFMSDYKNWLINNRYFTQEIFTVKNIENFEKRLLGHIIKNNEILKNQNNMDEKGIKNYLNNKKAAIDVWTERKSLEDNGAKINNLYTSYFDSNPTNSNYKNNIEDIKNCNILKFNLGSIEVVYKYDIKNVILDVEFSFSTNRFQNPSKMMIDKKLECNSENYKILEKYDRDLSDFTQNIQKILYKCFYDSETNIFTFRGKKTGPSINMLCAISLLLIDRDKNISEGLKNGDKFCINLAMLIFEEAFLIKRIGDLGQILLAKKLGYVFATNDHLQAIISILAGNATLTTCGKIKLFHLDNIDRLSNLLNVKCENIIGKKRK